MITFKPDEIFRAHFEVTAENNHATIVVDGVPHKPKWGDSTMNLFMKDLREAMSAMRHDYKELLSRVEELQEKLGCMEERLDECAAKAES